MYNPAPFAEDDPEVIAAMIERARLGVLVTHGDGGLFASHLPFVHDRAGGRLLGHVARANPHAAHAGEALVIFQGPHTYVSPSLYPTKAEHGRHVPTWNYEAVHVYGTVRWFDDPDELRALLDALTTLHEGARPEPWSVADAPADFVRGLLRAIVGGEIAITRVEAKRKLSQNRARRDREGVVEGLSQSADPRDLEVAAILRP